jgi:3'-phosphoadenosine 5'-phosphosulfate sulfotransferase (PAPS reductase)/FAD synthetase
MPDPIRETTPARVVSYFSAGAASAVATKLALAHFPAAEVAVVRCIVPNEHEDNARFAADCAAWFGQPIIEIRSADYADCWDVWERRRFLNGIAGAPCTLEMKKRPRQDFEREWRPDASVFGFTMEEGKRAKRFQAQNPEVRMLAPLIRAGLSKQDCMGMLARAGIQIPVMYGLGFANNNCRTCVKARSPGYWSLVRKCFPEDFARMAALSRDIGWTPCRASDDTPIWLDELPADQVPQDDSPNIECSLLCAIAEDKIMEAADAR